jgi:hypothetical protein
MEVWRWGFVIYNGTAEVTLAMTVDSHRQLIPASSANKCLGKEGNFYLNELIQGKP